MAPNRLAWCLLLFSLSLAGCEQAGGLLEQGKGLLEKGKSLIPGLGSAEPAAPDPAALRARRDSLARVRAAADSAARVKYTHCTDSVSALMRKTAKGRKVLAARLPEGMILPEFLSACGAPPAIRTAKAADSAGKTVAAAPAAGKPDTAGKKKAALTPAQLKAARADSVRRAREQARADSLAKAALAARTDSIRKLKADSVTADSARTARETEVSREVFDYAGGPRDPFLSLVRTATSGPELGDLTLVAIYQDMRHSRNSVAILRDRKSGRRYRLKAGQEVGRATVSQIRQKDVIFTVQDFGFERQETMSLRKQEEETP